MATATLTIERRSSALGAIITGWRGGSADKAGAATLSAALTAASEVKDLAAPTKTRLAALAGLFQRLAA